jgi:hypothetical protein
MPPLSGASFAVCYRPRGPIVRDFYHCRRIDEYAAFFLGNVLGPSATISSLLAVFIYQVASLDEPPGDVLAGVNRQLLALDFDEPPLIGMLAGRLDPRDGSFSLARAGLPAPVWLPANGPATTCGILGPFLGTADTPFETSQEVLRPGDRLVLAGDAVRIGENGDNGEGLPALAIRHRALTGQAFVDALERDLLQSTGPSDPITLMVIEKARPDRAGEPPLSLTPRVVS